MEIAMPDQTVSGSADISAEPAAGDGHAAGLGPALREQAGKLADRSKDAGVDTAHAVGKAAETAAHELDQAAPELANCIRSAATYAHNLADDLGTRSTADLLSDAIAWGRRQPLTALAGAAVLGFALARVVRSGADVDDKGRVP
jgi:hypothetical protein